MPYDPDIHHRRSIRIPGYDYTQSGGYFVTICTAQRECLFGEVHDDEVTLTDAGLIVKEEWFRTTHIRQEVVLDENEFVVMPNHIHGIVRIILPVGATVNAPPVGATGRLPLRAVPKPGPQAHSLGAMIAGYKAAVTKRINEIRGAPGLPVWQRNYWEHVIRDEVDLARICQYIAENPARWAEDQLHPNHEPRSS